MNTQYRVIDNLFTLKNIIFTLCLIFPLYLQANSSQTGI